ncbi:MAG: ASPIC/UnbV domain-containing protein [Bacteroidetes bacterium]|nr:MAG: ASPIC/UnbV domain-containing protein [Bacteroidota bacterium]
MATFLHALVPDAYSCVKIMSMKTTFTLFAVCFAVAVSSAQNFTKVTTGPLVNTPGDSRSVNWVDVNNDNLVDCFITNGPSGGQDNMLYLNIGNGTFIPENSLDTIVNDGKPSDGATFADYDNDGVLDCFVANWYNVNNMLYRGTLFVGFLIFQTGDIVTDGGYSETGSWGDYDNDGYVDMYVTNSAGTMRNFLYHNNGDHTFTKILTGSPVTDQRESRCVNWTDIDSDNDLDLFVTNESGQNENLYRNDGGGNFTSITTGALLTDGGKTMSGSWGDYDNDGDLDVFLANDQGNNALFRNDGNFNFTKIVSDTVSNSGGNSFSSDWSDVDNDGDLDLFVTNAFTTPARLVNFFYLNNGNGSFTRNSTSILANDSAWSYGCAFGDYDNDGFEDLAVATCRFNSMDENDFLYHNDGNSNHWITIRLAGTNTNRAAIGTKIRVHAVINGVPTWQLREISAQTSYCGQHDLRAHFGLGNATMIDSVIVEWLGQTAETYTNISADQFITITEGSGVTGIPAKQDAEEIFIYPNPAESMITVEWINHHFETGDCIIISSSNGQLLERIEVKTHAQRVPVTLKSNLAAGTYYVTVITKSGKTIRKLIKTK